MIGIRDDARRCYAILCDLIEHNTHLTFNHALHQAVGSLQKRYGGRLPGELSKVWDVVKLCGDPPEDYPEPEVSMRNLLVSEFNFTEEDRNVEEEVGASGGEVVEQEQFDNWTDKVEEGTGASQEPDTGDPPDTKRKKRTRKSPKNSG